MHSLPARKTDGVTTWGLFGVILTFVLTLITLELPYHTSGELLSISHLKVWGDTQEPRNDMAYLLVHTEDASEAESYGLALVWISPHQARASTMEEALGTLSTCISSGPNWPYVLAQLYEGSSHTLLPKDKHLGILPQGKVKSSCGQISQIEVCQLLSARSWVIYPVGLNGSDQLVTINLSELLHSSSSITTDEHPYMRIDIPLPTPEEPECTTLPLGGVASYSSSHYTQNSPETQNHPDGRG